MQPYSPKLRLRIFGISSWNSILVVILVLESTLFIHFSVAQLSISSFDPFMDSNLFFINWAGPLDLDKDEVASLGDRHMMITTNHKEQYRCILPEKLKASDDDPSKYTGPSADKLLEPLMKASHCSYRIESYWTYELCHGKHLKQYHETKEHGSTPKIQQYFLGYGNHRVKKSVEAGKEGEKQAALETETKKTEKDKVKQVEFDDDDDDGGEDESDDEPTKAKTEEVQESPIPKGPLPTREVDGVELPYHEIIMDGGTKCDLTGKPRRVHVLYVCNTEGRGEVYLLKESSTCVYEVVVLTSTLCSHPSFRPKVRPVSEIKCHSMPGSGLKPRELYKVNIEKSNLMASNKKDFANVIPEPREPRIIRKKTQQPQQGSTSPGGTQPGGAEPALKLQQPPQEPSKSNYRITISDIQMLKAFLSGGHCLTGGSGWWRHEICFGRFAKQFHIDKRTGKETKVYLGWWNKKEHIEWIKQNPQKKPHSPETRKWLALHYNNGDRCDITNRPRECEVRLKCLEDLKNPSAIMVSLSEPSSCSYVLDVEAAMFCNVIKEADENGIIDAEKIKP